MVESKISPIKVTFFKCIEFTEQAMGELAVSKLLGFIVC